MFLVARLEPTLSCGLEHDASAMPSDPLYPEDWSDVEAFSEGPTGSGGQRGGVDVDSAAMRDGHKIVDKR